MENKYLVVDWDWIEEGLNDEELEMWYQLLNNVTADKPEKKYIAVDTEAPYADRVIGIMNSGNRGVSRKEVLETLKELALLKDSELAREEAIELLLRYVADTEIEKAYEGVLRWEE